MKKRNAFTLIEILVVIAILSITAVAALPAYIYNQQKMRIAGIASQMASNIDTFRNLAVSGWSANDPKVTAAADQSSLPETLTIQLSGVDGMVACANYDNSVFCGEGQEMSATDQLEMEDGFFYNKILMSDDTSNTNPVAIVFDVPTGDFEILKKSGTTVSYPFAKIMLAENNGETDPELIKELVLDAKASTAYTCEKDIEDGMCGDDYNVMNGVNYVNPADATFDSNLGRSYNTIN